jgi:hypothetical protein
MGFTNSPSWAQAVLKEIFDDVLLEIECFIDDIGIFNNVWEKTPLHDLSGAQLT